MKHPDFSLIRTFRRVVTLLLWVVLVLPFVILFWACRQQKLRARAAQLFMLGTRRIAGLRLRVEGRPSDLRPLMIVSNHASYLDVFVIGSQIPVSFTPKREVRNWPVIGWFAVLADCVFVERRPSHMEEARTEMAQRLAEGRVLCLFPEGTTSDGKHLKPFKSGFLSLAEDHALPVQPASIAYTHIGDEIIADPARDMVAWIGDATFFGHFLHVLGLPYLQATLHWHAPLMLKDFADRKALTKAAETIITAGVLAALEREK